MGAALCRMAGGVSVTGDCYVSKGISNLMINNFLGFFFSVINSDVDDEPVSEVNLIYASQVSFRHFTSVSVITVWLYQCMEMLCHRNWRYQSLSVQKKIVMMR